MDKKQIILGIIALWVSIPVWGREITRGVLSESSGQLSSYKTV